MVDLVDETITRTVSAMAAARGIDLGTLAAEVGMSRTTIYRRRNHGGWTAAEVTRLAEVLGCTAGDLHTGLDGLLLPGFRPGAQTRLDASHR